MPWPHGRHLLRKDWEGLLLGIGALHTSLWSLCHQDLLAEGTHFLLQLEELLDLAVLEEIQQELADQGDLGQGPSTCL